MILSSFTSRFLFPLISLEGRAFWIVGLAPVSRSYLLREKVFLGLGISLILGLLTTLVSNSVLHSPPELFAGALFTLALAAAPSGSSKSSVRRLSGACDSKVLGSSEAQTISTPSVRAASRKSCVR